MSKTHRHIAKAKGLSVADLATACGMTRWGVRKCLNESREPKNPHVAGIYRKRLGLSA